MSKRIANSSTERLNPRHGGRNLLVSLSSSGYLLLRDDVYLVLDTLSGICGVFCAIENTASREFRAQPKQFLSDSGLTLVIACVMPRSNNDSSFVDIPYNP